MSHYGFPSDSRGLLVGDASMWISLTAIAAPHHHLKALGCRAAITDVALAELDRGRSKGRQCADEVAALIHVGLVEVVQLGVLDEDLYLSLVSGPATQTLDDGEAATLAWAAGHNAIAVIDERKATLIAGRRMPDVILRSTTDLFLAAQIVDELGEKLAAEALCTALIHTRMRVPTLRIPDVVALIGVDRARKCPSLPAAYRHAGADLQYDLDSGIGLGAEPVKGG